MWVRKVYSHDRTPFVAGETKVLRTRAVPESAWLKANVFERIGTAGFEMAWPSGRRLRGLRTPFPERKRFGVFVGEPLDPSSLDFTREYKQRLLALHGRAIDDRSTTPRPLAFHHGDSKM